MLRTHLISLPDLPLESHEAEVARRFTALVHSLHGDWKVDDEFTATRVHDGLEHSLVLSDENETIDVAVFTDITARASAASAIPGLIVALVALYVGHEVLLLTSGTGMVFTLVVALVGFIANWFLITRAIFVWPRAREIERAFAKLDAEVSERLGSTPGIVTRT